MQLCFGADKWVKKLPREIDLNDKGENMKVLFFFETGFDTPNPSFHLMNAMIEDTLNNGISVHMIGSHTTGENSDIPTNLSQRDSFTYDIVKRKNVEKKAFVRRYLEGIRYALASIRYIRGAKGCDLIYVQSCPTSLYNVLAAKLFGNRKPVIYSIQDMFPGSTIYSGVLKNKFLQKVFYNLQKIAYKKADYINVISEDMRDKVIEQGVPKEKITVIVDWCDNSKVRKIDWEDNLFVKKYNLQKEKFYVQYAGTMGFVFDYKMIVTVAKLLKGFNNIEFQMIGKGSQKENFIQECEKHGLNNVVFYPLEPLEMVPHVYSACSLELIPLKKGVIGNSVPSKASQVMACRRVVVNSVDPTSKYYKMFNDNNIGISVSNEEPEAVADAIIELYQNDEKRKLYAENGNKFGEIHYSRTKNTALLIDEFKYVAEKHINI